MVQSERWKVFNPSGVKRIIVTRSLPGEEWPGILTDAGHRVDVWIADESLSRAEITSEILKGCTSVIGQLTEKWDSEMFDILGRAGAVAYCNFAVGYDNVDVDAATRNNIAVGNTPGVLTEATAEMAVALTMSCARRITEADDFTRSGKFKGWLPDLLLGKRLWGSTLGVIGTGRIGSSYALMMARAFQMNLVYFDHKRNESLEKELDAFNEYLAGSGRNKIYIQFCDSVSQVLEKADIVSLHVPLTSGTRHMISKAQLQAMKPDAILINTSRGAVINEAELAEHCQAHPDFTAGLDVFELEPVINDLLKTLPNVTLAPHIASATRWTRENMSKLAALNIKGVLEGYPAWDQGSIDPFLGDNVPLAIPSILNKSVLRIY
jgi:hydroxypyruvate reductase 1